jgi:hypothetical protein
MPVPQVSHRTWWVAKANAQIGIGNKEIDARRLSFDKCITLIAPGKMGGDSWRGLVKSQKPNATYSHPEWDKATISWDAGDRDRSHRPTISRETMAKWDEWLNNEWPGLPIESFSFDKQLRLLLKRRHEWLDSLSTKIKIENTDTGEMFRNFEGSTPGEDSKEWIFD